ncbi:MAG: hypothetical protein SGBAC_010139 [Bacillariaceae sp.]
MTVLNAEQAMTIVGTIGGFAISLSLVPQVYLTYKTRCADDISYTYQVIYIFGTALVNAYAIYFDLYAVYIPCLVEFSLIVTLTIMKVCYPAREDLINSGGQRRSHSGSKEFEKNIMRKSITMMKQMAVKGHYDIEAPKQKDPETEELEDFTVRAGNSNAPNYGA